MNPLLIFTLILIIGGILVLFNKKQRTTREIAQNEVHEISETNKTFDKIIEPYLELSQSKVGHYLIFDIETTGLPKSYDVVPEILSNWPFIVSIGYVLYDKEHKLVANKELLLKQKKKIPQKATEVHGITNEMCKEKGLEPKIVFEHFQELERMSRVIISHNLEFDLPILQAEFLRNGLPKPFQNHIQFCTMVNSTNFVQLPSYHTNQYKYPKLVELFSKCFSTENQIVAIEEQHNAVMDAMLAAMSFFKMKELGVIQQDFE